MLCTKEPVKSAYKKYRSFFICHFFTKFLIVYAVFLLKYNFITNVYSETLLSKINKELAVNGLYASINPLGRSR